MGQKMARPWGRAMEIMAFEKSTSESNENFYVFMFNIEAPPL